MPGEFKLSVKSGIDWFELHGEVDFGGLSAPLPKLLEALRKGERFVALGDGTFGLLPEAAPLAKWIPNYDYPAENGLLAPAGTPKEIVARLHAEVVKALADADVRDKLQAQGLTPRGSTPEELRKATADQLAKYARLMKQAGITAE